MPPPSVKPPMPTDGHEPPGMHTPWPPSVAYTSARRQPAPMSAVPSAFTVIVLSLPRSTTRPLSGVE